MNLYIVTEQYHIYGSDYGKEVLAVFDSLDKAIDYISTLPNSNTRMLSVKNFELNKG